MAVFTGKPRLLPYFPPCIITMRLEIQTRARVCEKQQTSTQSSLTNRKLNNTIYL